MEPATEITCPSIKTHTCTSKASRPPFLFRHDTIWILYGAVFLLVNMYTVDKGPRSRNVHVL